MDKRKPIQDGGFSIRCKFVNGACLALYDNGGVVDINLAIINPYVGGVGDMMTQVEPAIAMALQDLDASDFLPGYRLNAYLAVSRRLKYLMQSSF